MKLKSIYIDGLHNAVAKTYDLDNLVYFYGRNGAGKTTVLNAIQLALLGYIPGTARNSREAILRHSPKGVITVRLEIANGNNTIHIERIIGKNGSKLNTLPSNFDISEIIKDLELPIFNFNDFIGQTANKLKEYFIKNILPTSEGGIDWKKTLKQGLFNVTVEDEDEIIAYGLDLISNVEGTPIEQVAKANTIFKEEQSFNKSELSRLQATIDSLIYYGDYKGPKDLDEINSKLLSLGAIRDALIRYESAKQVIDKNQSELQILKQTFDGMGGQETCNTINEDLNKYKTQYIEANDELRVKEQEIAELKIKKENLDDIVKNDALCPYTKTKCSAINIDSVMADILELTSKIFECSTAIAELKSKISAIDNTVRVKNNQLIRMQDLQNQINTLQNSLTALPDKPETDKTLSELDFAIEQYNEDKTKLQANKVYEDTIDNITSLKYKTELKNDAIVAWIKLTDTNGLQTSLTEKPFEELANTMTTYIQNMYGDTNLKAKFEVSTKANSFSFGIIRDGTYIAYDQLSSGEKCLYSLALMICIVNSSKSSLKLLLCDDMFDHLDSTSIENTFLALKKVTDMQFIFAGVKECKNAEDVMIKI